MKRFIPIIIAFVLISYFFIFLVLPFIGIHFFKSLGIFERGLMALLPITGVLLIGMVLYVLVERLREIKKEEKDDLSQY